ncbi:MAG: hypothetical protein JW973_15435 [Bacteroidales bacterium]|nr:hypothetical protein [Bacteroidales bacterium]
MKDNYINSTIIEMQERAKYLKTKMPVPLLDSCYYPIISQVNKELDELINHLEKLLIEPKFQIPSNQKAKLSFLQRIISSIDILENEVVSCINRWDDNDIALTKLIDEICKEIKFPLVSPIVTGLSQNYYCIDVYHNLLKVPLLEAEFFLHMPDLYHELAHLLLFHKNNPDSLAFLEYWGKFNQQVNSHFLEAYNRYVQNNGRMIAEQCNYLKSLWIESWSAEFFCDLFAVYTLGPAFVWANLHLCVKRVQNPFVISDSHPSDNARMEAAIKGLRMLEFENEADEISEYWKSFTNQTSILAGIDSLYKLAYNNSLIEQCVVMVLKATKEINCNIAYPTEIFGFRKTLNEAWNLFISEPESYFQWERNKRDYIKDLFKPKAIML